MAPLSHHHSPSNHRPHVRHRRNHNHKLSPHNHRLPRRRQRLHLGPHALTLTLTHAVVANWVYYFLPLYFQAVRGLSPLCSGIYMLPSVAGDGILSGVLLPAIQAPLDDSHVATATGVWSFARYFGCI